MPIYGKALKKYSPELEGHYDLRPWYVTFGTLASSKFVQMIILGWPWPTLWSTLIANEFQWKNLGSCLWCLIVILSLSHAVSWVRCGTCLYWILIFAVFLFFKNWKSKGIYYFCFIFDSTSNKNINYILHIFFYFIFILHISYGYFCNSEQESIFSCNSWKYKAPACFSHEVILTFWSILTYSLG